MLVVCLAASSAAGAILYVAAAGSNTSPYDTWQKAATNIQIAIDAAGPGDTVIVTNGLYDSGGRVVFGQMTNRIAITKPITVRSWTGPTNTTIRGVGGLGNAAVRCAYVTNGAVLLGFTLTNGYTRISGDYVWEEQSGGGVWGEPGSMVSNCIITGCGAFHGGGAYGRTNLWLTHCTLVGNSAWGGYAWSGGGAYSCSMSNCTVTGNRANWGGGTCGVILYNCVVSNNTGTGYGGGVLTGMAIDSQILNNTNYGWGGGGLYESRARDCVIRGNYSTNGGGVYWSYITNCVIESNSATYGGGTYNGVVERCILRGNTAANSGGGLYDGAIRNCLIVGNSANEGGGGTYFLNGGSLENCTVAGNSANYAGGICYGSADNCVIYSNTASPAQTAEGRQNFFNSTLNRTCTFPQPDSGSGNSTNDPCFAAAASGDFRLATNSPCIDAGSNKTWMTSARELDGRPRILHNTVDLGSYEAVKPEWDTDADWMRDWAELIAGTNPSDSNSVFRSFCVAAESGGLVVQWSSETGKLYRLQRSTNLLVDAFGFEVAEGVAAVPPVNVYTDRTVSGTGPWFYRVQVE